MAERESLLMSRIIFIEGVSGVGETTMAQHLCDKLRRLGYSASCYPEGDPYSPLDLC